MEQTVKSNDAALFRDRLVRILSGDRRILGVGQTGDINAPLISGKSDIDLFVICSSIPSAAERLAYYGEIKEDCASLHMSVCSKGVWGEGDVFSVGGIDVMPMYFSEEEMRNYLIEILDGKHLEKEGRFYPVGRLASIETLHVLYDADGTMKRMIDMVKEHPAEFFEKWIQSESWRILDEEDLGRAELRHEVLFYHQVVEEFLDHFLQVLYAKNNCYFPSRKRCSAFIERFQKKPERCLERLMHIIRTASDENSIDESVKTLREIGNELLRL